MSFEDEELFEHLGNGSCSICSLLEQFEVNLIANLQWDVETEQNSQFERIIREQKFSNYHFYMLFKMSNPQHHSKFLTHYIDDFVGTKLALQELWQRNRTIWQQTYANTDTLNQIFSQLYRSNDAFRKKFGDNTLFCLPHLQKILAMKMDNELKNELLRYHEEVLTISRTRMSTFIYKRYTETKQDERESPLHTIQLMAGYNGIRWSK